MAFSVSNHMPFTLPCRSSDRLVFVIPIFFGEILGLYAALGAEEGCTRQDELGRDRCNSADRLGTGQPHRLPLSLGARPDAAGHNRLGARLVGIIRVVGAVLVLLGALAATQLGLAPTWVLAAYLMVGAVSFGVYGFDKRAARRGDWRVSEAALHGIDLICGIAGGLIGQAVFRHKTRKEPFVVLTALIAVGHIAVLFLLALGFWHFPEFMFVD
jgi:uncharacterized membrane protein YsdA (DUF1294 family)